MTYNTYTYISTIPQPFVIGKLIYIELGIITIIKVHQSENVMGNMTYQVSQTILTEIKLLTKQFLCNMKLSR